MFLTKVASAPIGLTALKLFILDKNTLFAVSFYLSRLCQYTRLIVVMKISYIFQWHFLVKAYIFHQQYTAIYTPIITMSNISKQVTLVVNDNIILMSTWLSLYKCLLKSNNDIKKKDFV